MCYNIIKVSPYIPNPLRCYNCQKFGHHEIKCLKSPVCKMCGGSGSEHIELSCNNTIKRSNCQGNHPADSRDCMVRKREKEVNQIKYTNNISFPEARKIVQSKKSIPNHTLHTGYGIQQWDRTWSFLPIMSCNIR